MCLNIKPIHRTILQEYLQKRRGDTIVNVYDKCTKYLLLFV